MIKIRKLFWVVIVAIGLTVEPVLAQSENNTSVMTVIQQQLDAFAAGDFTRAFSFAAPSIRQSFGTAYHFMHMVQSGYAALISPLDVTFQDFDVMGNSAEQAVSVIARDGSAWMAHYTLQQMPDGLWRISGCWLEKLPGGAV